MSNYQLKNIDHCLICRNKKYNVKMIEGRLDDNVANICVDCCNDLVSNNDIEIIVDENKNIDLPLSGVILEIKTQIDQDIVKVNESKDNERGNIKDKLLLNIQDDKDQMTGLIDDKDAAVINDKNAAVINDRDQNTKTTYIVIHDLWTRRSSLPLVWNIEKYITDNNKININKIKEINYIPLINRYHDELKSKSDRQKFYDDIKDEEKIKKMYTRINQICGNGSITPNFNDTFVNFGGGVKKIKANFDEILFNECDSDFNFTSNTGYHVRLMKENQNRIKRAIDYLYDDLYLVDHADAFEISKIMSQIINLDDRMHFFQCAFYLVLEYYSITYLAFFGEYAVICNNNNDDGEKYNDDVHYKVRRIIYDNICNLLRNYWR